MSSAKHETLADKMNDIMVKTKKLNTKGLKLKKKIKEENIPVNRASEILV